MSVSSSAPASRELDRRWMARALELAQKGLYSAAPNPRVGCVIANGEEFLGEGFHARAGEAHAEVRALQAAGHRARGATAYLGLEPCSHEGRTPPCAQALITAGIGRVVAAIEDPNPQVSGSGFEALRAAGMQVEVGLLAEEASALNAGFIKRMSAGRPRVTVKLGASLDGRTSMPSGESRWITGPAAREDVQRLRGESCAIVTGIGTILADDPRLDLRLPETLTRGRQPLRVVLDTGLKISPDARIFSPPGQAMICTSGAESATAARLRAGGVAIEILPRDTKGLDLPALLDFLAGRECNEVLVEAGPVLAGSFVAAGLADRLVVYLAPVLMGSTARGMFALPALPRLADRVQWRFTEFRPVGEDLRITAVPA